MRNPKDFFQPMALGAPAPLHEIPFKPSRMIHFFDPSNAKMAAKVPDMAKQCDVLLGNLEDAIQADNKIAAREGLIKRGETATRIHNNCSGKHAGFLALAKHLGVGVQRYIDPLTNDYWTIEAPGPAVVHPGHRSAEAPSEEHAVAPASKTSWSNCIRN